VLTAALVLLAVALVAILLQLQSRVDGAAQRQAAMAAQLEAQRRAFEMAQAVGWARMGSLEQQLESARQGRAAPAEPPVLADKQQVRARPAAAHAPPSARVAAAAPAPAAAVAPAASTTPSSTAPDPLLGLTDDLQ
jgi:hypothetical protein